MKMCDSTNKICQTFSKGTKYFFAMNSVLKNANSLNKDEK